MSEQSPFDPFFDRIGEIVRKIVREELAAKPQEKLLYSTREAAAKLGVEENWLASKARVGLVPSRQLGHYRMFSMADIEAIVENSKTGLIPQAACDKVDASLDGGAENGNEKERPGGRVSRPHREQGR